MILYWNVCEEDNFEGVAFLTNLYPKYCSLLRDHDESFLQILWVPVDALSLQDVEFGLELDWDQPRNRQNGYSHHHDSSHIGWFRRQVHCHLMKVNEQDHESQEKCHHKQPHRNNHLFTAFQIPAFKLATKTVSEENAFPTLQALDFHQPTEFRFLDFERLLFQPLLYLFFQTTFVHSIHEGTALAAVKDWKTNAAGFLLANIAFGRRIFCPCLRASPYFSHRI